MNLTLENILLISSLLLGLSVLAGKTSFRLGVPTLILFVFIGMLAGSEGIGKINFNDPGIARFIGIVAKWLHVSVPEKAKQRTPPDIELSDTMKSELTEIEIDEKSPSVGKRIVDLGFPRAALIALIKRNGVFVTPNGSTVIKPFDKLVIIAENAESLKLVHECLEHRGKAS